jgi:hypothetical protein
MAGEFRVRFKYKMAIMGDCFLGRLEHRLGAVAVLRPLPEQLRLVLPQLRATEAEDVGLTRPGTPLTIPVSDLSTWSCRAYTI